MESATQVVGLYRKRMQIEEAFRDAKNYRFGWSFKDARSESVERLRILLLVAAIGMLALTLVGMVAEHNGLNRKYLANTIRKRRVLSLFVLGMLVAANETDKHALTRMLAGAIAGIRELAPYNSTPTEQRFGQFCGDP